MSEPNFEAIGRYHHLVKQARAAAQERGALLARAARILGAASTTDVALPCDALARAVNFDAAADLLAQARAADGRLRELVRQIAELAPIADERVWTIAS